MQLTESTNVLEAGHESKGKKVEMAIKEEDMHLVIQYMTHKMYSNPLRTICQEYMCNARDAQRELGNADKPIHIKLPNMTDPNFVIQDFGIGIDEERMWNVFANLAASTKRSNDNETGGFGLGAKSAFSYTDQFNIQTIIPDGNGGLEVRLYSCAKHTNKILLQEVVECRRAAGEGEERGTSIVIPIHSQDFSNVRRHVIRAASFWKVRPTISGTAEELEWNTMDYALEHETWGVKKQKYSYRRDNAQILVDDIPYPLDYDSVLDNINYEGTGITKEKLANVISSGNMVFKANVGDVAVSVDREKLDYSSPKTLNYMLELYRNVVADVQTSVDKIVKDSKTWLEAHLAFKNGISDVLPSDVYKSCTLEYKKKNININIHSSSSIELDMYILTRDSSKKSGIGRQRATGLSLDADLYIEDRTGTASVSLNCIRTLLEEDDKIDTIFVFKWTEGQVNRQGKVIDNIKKHYEKEYLYNGWKLRDLTDVEPTSLKRQRVSNSIAGSDGEYEIRTFNTNSWCDYRWSKSEMTDYSTRDTYYIKLYNRRAYALVDNEERIISDDAIANLIGRGLSIVGVPSRLEKRAERSTTMKLLSTDEVKKITDKAVKVLAKSIASKKQTKQFQEAMTYSHFYSDVDTKSDLDHHLVNNLYMKTKLGKIDPKLLDAQNKYDAYKESYDKERSGIDTIRNEIDSINSLSTSFGIDKTEASVKTDSYDTTFLDEMKAYDQYIMEAYHNFPCFGTWEIGRGNADFFVEKVVECESLKAKVAKLEAKLAKKGK